MKAIRILWTIPVLATAAMIIGCHQDAPKPIDEPSLPAVHVRVATASLPTEPAVIQVVGTVQPRLTSVIAAKVSGRVTSMKNRIGERVNAGDLLVAIDAGEIIARAEQAEAALENARSDLARFERLREQSAVTQSEFETVQTRYRVAEAGAAEARTMMGYVRIVAPFDAVIVRTHADVGDLASPGMPLLELNSTDGLRFESNVPDSLADGLEPGQELTVTIEGVPDPIRLNLSEVAPSSDPRSRTRTVRLNLDNMSGVRAGQFGRLALPTHLASNLWVPTSAVVERGQMEMVFVPVDGIAQMRLVRTGGGSAEQTEILSGLQAGEDVVVDGSEGLRDGQPLVITE